SCFLYFTEQFKVIGSAMPIVFKAGEDVVLPCFLEPNISAVDMTVEWFRTDWTETDTLVHLYEGHEDRNEKQIKSYRGRTALFREELKKGNTSLKLSALQPSDRGSYKCFIKSESWHDDTILDVEVNSKSTGEDLVLPCSLQPRISAEEMMVEWFRLHETDTLVHLYKEYEDRNADQMECYRGRTALFKDALRKGNASLKLSALQTSDEGAYKCLIQYGESWLDDIIVYVEVKGKRHNNYSIVWKIFVTLYCLYKIMVFSIRACYPAVIHLYSIGMAVVYPWSDHLNDFLF
uniref:Ig-like domain-containing protein n=1 Tax=Astyanax mexicanus TaxID=7994 RepID=A0A8B9GWK0_ASTMX